jgi:hypothetical protein
MLSILHTPNVKTSPKNQWVWELKERMEEAHAKVRQNTRTAMLRQKRYHDLKLSVSPPNICGFLFRMRST